MAWRTCIALDEYRAEVNWRFPNRSKISDGTIGDVAHAGQGQGSDHNPWVVRGGVGVVRAFDLTHDPRNGVDCEKLSDYLFEMGKAGDPRLRNGGYIIFNNWITNADWRAWRRYDGSNPHTSHMHVSFSTDFFDNRGDWSKAFGPAAPTPPPAGGGMNIEQEIRNQLTGSAELGKYPGWKQLGGRTVVDAIAVIGAKLDIEGFDPKAGKR